MIALFVGLIIGFLMCIPIGPINVWVINTHLKKGPISALSIALGGSIMDFIYFFIILSGLSLIKVNEDVMIYFKTFGIGLIFILGIKELLTSHVEFDESSLKKETPKGIVASLVLGVILYTSNPTLIVTMTGLGAFVKSLGYFTISLFNSVLVSFGLALGSFFWFVFLVKVVERYQEKIKTKYYKYFVKVSGGLMVGFSLFMGRALLLAKGY